MTPTEAIAVIQPLLNDAMRRRDDRGNQFGSVHFAAFSPSMKEFYRREHADAVAQVEAFTLAISLLQKAQISP